MHPATYWTGNTHLLLLGVLAWKIKPFQYLSIYYCSHDRPSSVLTWHLHLPLLAVWRTTQRPLVLLCTKENEGARVLAALFHCCKMHSAGGSWRRAWSHCKQELVTYRAQINFWWHWKWGEFEFFVVEVYQQVWNCLEAMSFTLALEIYSRLWQDNVASCRA